VTKAGVNGVSGAILAPSGVAARWGLGEWGGRRLAYRGDSDLEGLPNHELHLILLDLLLRISRTEADMDGRAVDRLTDVRRASKTDAMAREKALVVASTVNAINDVLKNMKASPTPIEVCFASVAATMEADGRKVHRSTLYRRREYRDPILKAMGMEPPDDASKVAVADPEYARVAGLTKPELVEEIRRAGKRLKAATRALEEYLESLG
jgi:hypothetical protein